MFQSSGFSSTETPGLKRFYSENHGDEKGKKGGGGGNESADNDKRTLYERLKENQMRMDEEFAEKTKFRAPAALDQDDVNYYEERERKRIMRELQAEEEDQAELDKVLKASKVYKPEETEAPLPPPVSVKPKVAKTAPLVQVKVIAKPKPASSKPSAPPQAPASPPKETKRKHATSEWEDEPVERKKVTPPPKPQPPTYKPKVVPASSSSTSSNSVSSSSATKQVDKPVATASSNPLGDLLSYSDDDE